nr:argininosuccinate synthase [Coriobacterium glomerans]
MSAHLVEVAHRFGASAIAHGCTGKGNDQIRFETSVLMLDPTLDIIAPLREWGLHSRPEEVAYACEHGVDVPEGTGDNPYSIDDNLWGRAIECGALEDPWSEPPHDVWTMTADPQETPDDPAVCETGFERGVPVSLDDVRMPLSELVVALNALAGQYGFGRLDLMENRLVGLKSRECYEVPGALSIIIARRALEDLTLERDVAHEKLDLERTWATCVYNGQWFSPLKRALDAFMAETQKGVTGVVRLRFLKGRCTVIGRKSARSLYDLGLATYDRDSTFDERAASGFLELQTLSLKTWAKVQGPDVLACEPLACDLVANPALR